MLNSAEAEPAGDGKLAAAEATTAKSVKVLTPEEARIEQKADMQRIKQSVLSGIMEPLMPYLLSFHSQTVFLNFQQMENLLCQSIDWSEAAKNKVNSMN